LEILSIALMKTSEAGIDVDEDDSGPTDAEKWLWEESTGPERFRMRLQPEAKLLDLEAKTVAGVNNYRLKARLLDKMAAGPFRIRDKVQALKTRAKDTLNAVVEDLKLTFEPLEVLERELALAEEEALQRGKDAKDDELNRAIQQEIDARNQERLRKLRLQEQERRYLANEYREQIPRRSRKKHEQRK
jgi:hypothetical protein